MDPVLDPPMPTPSGKQLRRVGPLRARVVIAYSTSRVSFPSRLISRSSRHTCATSGQSR